MCHIAGVRSTRRLMAIHPGASPPSCSPHSSNCSQQAAAERAQALHTHPGWEHFMIITVIFPQKIIHRGLCQNWIAQSLEHMVQILCEECGESGRMPLWRSSADCQRLPDPSKCLVLSAFTSLCLGLLFSLCSLNFPFMPLITRKASFSTCCVSALWTVSKEFTKGAGLHVYFNLKT